MEKNIRNKGITLIALVVTIIILLILAGITISLVFGSNGVILKAQDSKEQTEIGEMREKLEMAKVPVYADGNGSYKVQDYWDRIESEGLIADKTVDIIDNGDGTYEVTTTPGYVFEITVEPNKEIAEKLKVTEYEISVALDSLKEPVSMYEPIYNDGGDTIYLYDQIAVKEDEYGLDNRLALDRAMKNLKKRELNILKDRFIVGKTQMEIAEELGISQAQISRIEKNAINTIKKNIK